MKNIFQNNFFEYIYWIFYSLAILILLFSRGLGLEGVSESLWTEDANILINQANKLGWVAYITSYQGYFILFQRMAASVAVQFPLYFIPYVLFSFSIVAFYILGVVLKNTLLHLGVDKTTIVVFVFLLLLQPNSGEVFFSATNTQWFLGLTLALFVCNPLNRNLSPIELIIIFIASLTGPFSLLMIPVLLIQLITLRDLKQRKYIYLTIFGCSIVQAVSVLNSTRFSVSKSSGTVNDWINSFETFITFGSSNPLIGSLSILILIGALGLFLRTKKLQKKNIILYFLLMAIVVYLASLFSVSRWSIVSTISPVGGGARYFFIPYGILLISYLLIYNGNKILQRLYLVSLAIIFFSLFHPNQRPNLYWSTFSKFASANERVREIPIHPQWNFVPTWKVDIPKIESNSVVRQVPHTLKSVVWRNNSYYLNVNGICGSSSELGFEISASLESSGLYLLKWGSGSLMRYFSSGSVNMHFAVKRNLRDKIFTLSSNQLLENFNVREVKVFCL